MSNSTIIKDKTSEQKSYDDDNTIRTILDGDRDSFRIILDKYSGRIRNLIYLILNDYSIVDDLAQDIFLKAYESLGNYRFESSFYTWIYKIAVNKCRDEIRKKKIRKIVSLDFLFTKRGEIMNPENEYESIEDNLLINDALAKLSNNQREIIVLRDINNLSYQEIGEILNCETGTVKSRLARARMELAKLIKRMIGEHDVKKEKNKASISLS
jgi:RNA polymerase sigma-70 factor (ECF subfamily)